MNLEHIFLGKYLSFQLCQTLALLGSTTHPREGHSEDGPAGRKQVISRGLGHIGRADKHGFKSVCTLRVNLWLPGEMYGARDSEGVWDGHIHTAIFKMGNQQGPAVEHTEPCSMLCGSLGERGVWGRTDIRICMTGFSVHGIFQARDWSGLPFPFPGDLPDPEIKPRSPALQRTSSEAVHEISCSVFV